MRGYPRPATWRAPVGLKIPDLAFKLAETHFKDKKWVGAKQ